MVVRKAVSWLQNIQLILIVCLVLLCVGGIPFGIKGFAVLSGSMEPEIPVGSYAYVRQGVVCSEIEEGDIIAFNIGDDKVVTHRVVVNDMDAQLLTTKGDANDTQDLAPVSYGNVVGETVFCIPNLGFVLMHLYNNKWAWIVGLVAFNALLLVIAARMRVPEIRNSVSKGK